MNALLEEMRRSMEELQLGLDGALNMSDKMEALAKGIATNQVGSCAWCCRISIAHAALLRPLYCRSLSCITEV
jgi:hypothetical protein